MRMLRQTSYQDGLLGQSILRKRNGAVWRVRCADQKEPIEPGNWQEATGTEKGGEGMELTMQVPKHAEEILEQLNNHGFEAYVVGGCVRDSLLQRVPGDWDITTSARPEQVKAIFGHTIDTGLQHGTVTIMRDKVGYEVTTYRIDGEYEDGRHPKEVEFTSNLLEDLKRRDFTIP